MRRGGGRKGGGGGVEEWLIVRRLRGKEGGISLVLAVTGRLTDSDCTVQVPSALITRSLLPFSPLGRHSVSDTLKNLSELYRRQGKTDTAQVLAQFAVSSKKVSQPNTAPACTR